MQIFTSPFGNLARFHLGTWQKTSFPKTFFFSLAPFFANSTQMRNFDARKFKGI